MQYHILKRKNGHLLLAALLAFGCMSACGSSGSQPRNDTPTPVPTQAQPSDTDPAPPPQTQPSDTSTTPTPQAQPSEQPPASENNPSEGDNDMDENSTLAAKFDGITLAEGYKKALYNNPVMTQRFGADPYALIYDGRVYLYMSGDVFEYESNGEIKSNSFGKINTLCVISSSDMVNWTDHGTIYAAGRDGAAT